jgi:hypothetical protein
MKNGKVSTSKKILGVLLGAALLFVVLVVITPAPADENLNVTLGGWKFTLGADGWVLAKAPMMDRFSSPYDPDFDLSCGDPQLPWTDILWCGGPFYYPAYPPDKHQSGITGSVEDIEVMNIPADTQGMSTDEVLGDAAELVACCPHPERPYDEQYTTFKGHEAFLRTWEGEQITTATLAVLLDNNTVAVIDAEVNLPGDDDKQVYSGTAEDVLNTLSIEKVA